MSLFALLFSFKGRVNRAKYWLFALLWVVLWTAAFLLVLASNLSPLAFGLAVLILIPSLVSGIALGVKRLHDRDKSGWWLLLFYLAPGVLDGIGKVAGGSRLVLAVASFAVSVWALVELGCLRGNDGPNRFGGDPLAG